MGLSPTPWDDQLFAQKGELYHNQAQAVTWLPDYFNQVCTQLRVATPNAIDTALAGDPNAASLGPFVDGDADTEAICYHHTCYVLPCYVPLFLAGPLTPGMLGTSSNTRLMQTIILYHVLLLWIIFGRLLP